MLLALLSTFIGIQWIECNIMKKGLFNATFLIMGPYIILSILNNICFVHMGFIRISETTLFFLLWIQVIFFFGDFWGQICAQKIKDKMVNVKEYSTLKINYPLIKVYILSVCVLRIGTLLIKFFSFGVEGMIANDFAHFGLTGIVAHLQLSIKPLLAVLFYSWTKNRKDYASLLIVCLGIIITFSSFIKYHVITLVLMIFIYYCINRPHKFIKIGITTLGMIFLLFIGNYLLGFILRGTHSNFEFYVIHLWKYIAGGTINTDVVLNNSNQYMMSIEEWLRNFLMPFPSMFINKFIKSYSSITIWFPFTPVMADGSELSNVVSTAAFISFLPSIVIEISMFCFWGWFSALILRLALSIKSLLIRSFATVFFTYNILSFFSCFFRLSAPWEELMWSIIIVIFIHLRISRKPRIQ